MKGSDSRHTCTTSILLLTYFAIIQLAYVYIQLLHWFDKIIKLRVTLGLSLVVLFLGLFGRENKKKWEEKKKLKKGKE